MNPYNLLADLPTRLPDEQFDCLIRTGAVRLERIVSTGHATPLDQWYDQPWDEWVLLLAGSAVLRFQQPDETVSLRPGDSLLIPAHRRHRVEHTDRDAPTVWLALHYEAQHHPPNLTTALSHRSGVCPTPPPPCR